MPADRIPFKKGGSAEQQERVRYAWAISGDPDFVALLEAENGHWDEHRRNVNRDGSVDIGHCQINAYWHPHITNDERFGDWRWQIRKCLELYEAGTPFYGNIERGAKNFTWR